MASKYDEEIGLSTSGIADSDSDKSCQICQDGEKEHFCQGCLKGVCSKCFRGMTEHRLVQMRNVCFFCRQPFLPADKIPIAPIEPPVPQRSWVPLDTSRLRPIPRCHCNGFFWEVLLGILGVVLAVAFVFGFVFCLCAIADNAENEKKRYERSIYARWPHTTCHWQSIGFQPGHCQSGCEELEDSCYTNATGLPPCSQMLEQGVNGSCRGVPTCCQWSDGPEAVCIGFAEAPLKRIKCPLYCGTMTVLLTYDGMEHTYEQYCQDMPCDTWQMADECHYDAHDLDKLPLRGRSSKVWEAIYWHDGSVDAQADRYYFLLVCMFFLVPGLLACIIWGCSYLIPCRRQSY